MKARASLDTSCVSSAEDSIKAMMREILNESRNQQQTIVDALQLPRRELQAFNGDSLRYWAFIQAFKSNVDKCNVDDAAKLSVLLQSCVGPARKILQCTELMSPEVGYKRALDILESRYGDKYEISQKWIEAHGWIDTGSYQPKRSK